MPLADRLYRAYCILFLTGYGERHPIPRLARLPILVWRRFCKAIRARAWRHQVDREWVRSNLHYPGASCLSNWREPARVQNNHQCFYYDIDKALSRRHGIEGAAIIFFMGIGDYLYATPAIEALRRRYGGLRLYGYVSGNIDCNNAPQVYNLLKANPNFSRVFRYDGHRDLKCWKNYDYTEAMKDIPDNFLILPLTYEVSNDSMHRVQEIYKTLSLEIPAELPRPLVHTAAEVGTHVRELAKAVEKEAKHCRGVCFVQFEHRSSGYSYPYGRELHEALAANDYLVLTTDQDVANDGDQIKRIDFNAFSIQDSFALLHRLKNSLPGKFCFLGCNSMSWALSGGLDVPNLSVQHRTDENNHSLWFRNITVLAPHLYEKIPRECQIVDTAHETVKVRNRWGKSVEFYNYRPDILLRHLLNLGGK